MFNRKLKKEIKELLKFIDSLEDKIRNLEQKEVSKFYGKSPLVDKNDLRISVLENRIADLTNPQKFKGFVFYKGKKHEVLSSHVERQKSVFDFFPDEFIRKYTILDRVDGELIPIHGVLQCELSKTKK